MPRAPRDAELSCYPIIRLYKFVDLLSVFLLSTYMATPLLPLLYQERKSLYAPSFLRGAHHPLEFSSPDNQLKWGTQSLRNSKEFILLKAVQLFPTYGEGNILLQFCFVLKKSRSPASFLRNFQTILTRPAKPCIVIFAVSLAKSYITLPLPPSLCSLKSSIVPSSSPSQNLCTHTVHWTYSVLPLLCTCIIPAPPESLPWYNTSPPIQTGA